MKFTEIFIALGAAAAVVIIGTVIIIPVVFAHRVWPGVYLGGMSLAGLNKADLPTTLAQQNEVLQRQTVTVELKNKQVRRTVGELGLALDVPATSARSLGVNWLTTARGWPLMYPVFQTDRLRLNQTIKTDFAGLVAMPQNAFIKLAPNDNYIVMPGKEGEGPNTSHLANAIGLKLQQQDWSSPVTLALAPGEPDIPDEQVAITAEFANQLLLAGFFVNAGDQAWPIKPFTLKRLINFSEQPDARRPGVSQAVVVFNETELRGYLEKTLVPEINQEAQSARFARVDDKVQQLAEAKEGKKLDIDASMARIAAALAERQFKADLQVNVTEPLVKEQADLDNFNLSYLLTTGVTNFSGSPQNRRHNIEVGTAQYQGILIAPSEEFSFNQHLGPVDAEHGFKPELVIKNHLTIPEFGGGLCQVSTTLFRAAVQAGLEVTQRRNHAYAVRYYGKPGFDATIYPPYTDLRFINNTPGHILIQARVEGNQVIFEFWGTDDGRQVEVKGPTTYGALPDGSIKATLSQKVTKDGQVIVDQTFRSNYKSPSLYPHSVAVDDPNNPKPGSVPVITPNVSQTPTPNPSPAAHPAAAPTKI